MGGKWTHESIFALARSLSKVLVWNVAEQEDLASALYLKGVDVAERIPEMPKAGMAKSMRNAAIDIGRKNAKHGRVSSYHGWTGRPDGMESDDESPLEVIGSYDGGMDNVHARLTLEYVALALGDHRDLFVMKAEGLTRNEIARLHGVSRSAIDRRMNRAREKALAVLA